MDMITGNNILCWQKEMASNLSKILNSIFFSKENLLEKDGLPFLKDYNPYLINKFVVKHNDIKDLAVILNGYHNIPKDEHYEFLLYMIPKKKRFVKFKKSEENKDIELIQKHYNYNKIRAREVLRILSEDDLKELREMYDYEHGEYERC